MKPAKYSSKVLTYSLATLLLASLSLGFQPKITKVGDNHGNIWNFNPDEDETYTSVDTDYKLNASKEPAVELCVNEVQKAEGDELEFKFSSPVGSTTWQSQNCKEWQLTEEDYNQDWNFRIEVRNQDETYYYHSDNDFKTGITYNNIVRDTEEDENIVTEDLNSNSSDTEETIENFNDLSHFPRPFIGQDTKRKPKIVVGEDAKPVDIVSAIDITGASSTNGINTTNDSQLGNSDSVELDSPTILVGGPVVNDITARLASSEEATPRENYTEGKAFIEYINDPFNQSQDVIIVAGETGEDTRAAANFLSNYEENLRSLESAKKIIIDTETREVIEKYPN